MEIRQAHAALGTMQVMTNPWRLLACFALSMIACDDSGGSSTLVDANPGAPLCTRALYDRCNTAEDCASGICRFYNMGGFSACTQACSAAAPCPMQAGAATQPTCNNNGQCRVTAPNECRLP